MGYKICYGYGDYLLYQTLTIEISAEKLQRNQYSTLVEEDRLALGNESLLLFRTHAFHRKQNLYSLPTISA